MDDRAGLPVSAQDGGQEGEGPSGNVVLWKRFSDYSKSTMLMTGETIVAYYSVHEDINKHAIGTYFMVCRSLLCFTLLADVALMLVTLWLLPLEPISKRLYVATKILTYFTGILTMLTSVSLLLLLNPRYAVVTILVLPAMAIVSIVFYKGINASQDREVTDYEAHKSELKQFFDLSSSVTGAAFGGMIATIFGYFTNFPKDVHQVDVKFSEAFIFVTVISGLLVMQLTTVPALLPDNRGDGSPFLNFIKVLSYSLFVLLALTGLAAAAEFLEVFILLVFIPIFYAVVVWLSMDFNNKDETSQTRSPTSHETDASVTITTLIFASLMGIYSVYFGREENDPYLQTCMFFMLLAFMSSLVWMLLAFRGRRTKAVKMLTYSTICWLVFAMPGLLFLAIRTG